MMKLVKDMGKHGIKWEDKIFVHLDFEDNLGLIDQNFSDMIGCSEVKVQGTERGLKIDAKKTNALRLGNVGDVTLGNKEIDHVSSFTLMGSIYC